MKPKIILHGGIESSDDRNKDEIESALDDISRYAFNYLANHSAVETVKFAICMLEDNELFNAGTGALPQYDGVQRLDASIMDGYTRSSGAVAQIHGIKNPIEVAELVMGSPDCLIVGDEAQKFAYLNGMPAGITLTRSATDRWFKERGNNHYGTVGAVSIDAEGKIAAGTSTGGWVTSIPGRVGDVPIIGAGTYANRDVGVSCTGDGAKILTISLSRLVSLNSRGNLKLEEAVSASLDELSSIGGIGGLISIDKTGCVLHKATNGVYMPVSYMPKS